MQVDPERIETARQVFLFMCNNPPPPNKIRPGETIYDVVCEMTNGLHDAMDKTATQQTGHPAETALEQIFDLLKDAPDERIVKWVRANAKLRGMRELCVYLGSERE